MSKIKTIYDFTLDSFNKEIASIRNIDDKVAKLIPILIILLIGLGLIFNIANIDKNNPFSHNYIFPVILSLIIITLISFFRVLSLEIFSFPKTNHDIDIEYIENKTNITDETIYKDYIYDFLESIQKNNEKKQKKLTALTIGYYFISGTIISYVVLIILLFLE